LEHIVAEFDKQGTDKIDFNEFLAIIINRISEPDSLEEITKSWDALKDPGTNKITFESLQRVAADLGEDMTSTCFAQGFGALAM